MRWNSEYKRKIGKRNEYQREYWANNSQEMKEYLREWRIANPTTITKNKLIEMVRIMFKDLSQEDFILLMQQKYQLTDKQISELIVKGGESDEKNIKI